MQCTNDDDDDDEGVRGGELIFHLHALNNTLTRQRQQCASHCRRRRVRVKQDCTSWCSIALIELSELIHLSLALQIHIIVLFTRQEIGKLRALSAESESESSWDSNGGGNWISRNNLLFYSTFTTSSLLLSRELSYSLQLLLIGIGGGGRKVWILNLDM